MIDPRYVSTELSPAVPEHQRVLLVRIAEEAGEVVQAVAKILRWGPDSINPMALEKGTNLLQFVSEMHDLTTLADQYYETQNIPTWASQRKPPRESGLRDVQVAEYENAQLHYGEAYCRELLKVQKAESEHAAYLEETRKWTCPGCGHTMRALDAWYFRSHAANCDWTSLIPLSGHSGYRPGEPGFHIKRNGIEVPY